MRTRHRRLFCLTTLALIALGLGLAGCAWGTVTDSKTGEPIVGAEVTFEDSNGNTGTTTTGAGGLYAFDAAKGQAIPAAGSTTYTISAPGYDTVTIQRNVAYDDNQSAIWEIQGFALTREGEEPPPPQSRSVSDRRGPARARHPDLAHRGGVGTVPRRPRIGGPAGTADSLLNNTAVR